MKKFLVIVLFALNFSLGFSQARLGYSFDEITKEFAKYYKISVKNISGISTLIVYTPKYNSYYVLNEKGLCYLTLINPSTEEYIVEFIDKFNLEYISIGKDKWLSKEGKERIKVELVEMSDIGKCFSMKRVIME